MNVFDALRADIETRVQRFQAQNPGVVVEPPDDWNREAACAACKDSGWVVETLGEPLVECTSCDVVTTRRRERFGKLGPVPAPYNRFSFSDFPAASAGMKRARKNISDLAKEAPRHVFLHGPVGSGKTSLGSCLYRAWLAQGVAGMWFTVGGRATDGRPGLLQNIRDSYDAESRKFTTSALLEAVGTVPLLFLDDIGAERVTDWVAEQLWSVVNSRQERPTIFTSNLDLAGLCDRLGGLDGERIVSRIQGMCEPDIYFVDGPDLRQSKNRGAA